jgi:hypothetical protein
MFFKSEAKSDVNNTESYDKISLTKFTISQNILTKKGDSVAKKYTLLSFYLMLTCLSLATYSLYSNINNTWMVAPPNIILFIISLCVFVLGILGF